MRTKAIRKEDVENGTYPRNWWVFDAAEKPLGRLASQIAKVLRGKHKPIFTPHVDLGDFVVVVNAEKVLLTGKKKEDKLYYRHTGYPGGLKTTNAADLLKNKPTALVENAVKGMMPKNALNRSSLSKLKVYAGEEHPHSAQKPKTWDFSTK